MRALRSIVLATVIAAAWWPAGASAGEPAPAGAAGKPITVTDALGRHVTLPSPPTRILITGKAFTLIVDAAYTFQEARTRLAALARTTQGTGDFAAFLDPDYAAKEVVGESAGAEDIAAHRPDLVILKSYLAQTLGRTVETIGLPVVYVDFETPEQYPRDIGVLAAVFGNPQRGQDVAAFYESKLARIRAAVATETTRPTALLLYVSEREGAVAFKVPPASWMQTRLIELAGGRPVWAGGGPGKGWLQVTFEQVAAWDPDFIFVTSYRQRAADVVANLKRDTAWRSLRAVQAGRLLAFPGDFYSWDQPDTRWILGLTWLAGRMHPAAFPGLDVEWEAMELYAKLYGVDRERFDRQIRPRLCGDLR